MDSVRPTDPPAALGAMVSIAFGLVFSGLCLISLPLALRFAGGVLIGMSSFQGLRGRVPMVGYSGLASSYMTGLPAVLLSAGMVFLGVLMLLQPDWILAAILAGHPELAAAAAHILR